MHKKALLLSILFISCSICSQNYASAERIRAFVPNKPWEVGIELENFAPWDVLQQKTILGGKTSTGMIITIIAEKEKPPITPNQILKKYWVNGRPGEHIVEFTNASMIIVSAKDTSPVLGQAFNGYALKDDQSFDIHVSADLSKTTKEQVLKTIRSFGVILSPEAKAIDQLSEALKSIRDPSKQKQVLLAFTEKYPKNSWAFACLGDVYFRLNHHDLAEEAYLQALENHKTQPITNPITLWLCYDGLGMIFGMSRRYEPAKLYFEKGYACAEDMESHKSLADSAYNLACLYAETGDLKLCLKYLSEAVKLNSVKKAEAKTDSSFASIRNQAEFKTLISQ